MSIEIDYTYGTLESTFLETLGDSTGSATLDLTSGNVFSYTPTADTTFTFSNPPVSGTAYSFTLKLTGANVTTGFDIANASYDSVSFSVASQVPVPASLYFRSDGLKLYVLDGSTNGDVYQYSLSTAWDVSTASYDSINQSSLAESSPAGLFFKPDGTKMYITGFNSDAIQEINLSTAWDISNASVYQSFSILSQTSTPTGIHFNYNGTLVFITGTGEDSVFKYSLSTAWDISTASLSQTLDISAQESNPQDIFLSSNGNKLFVTGQNGVVIDEYYLSTAYDLSTASHTTSFSTSSQETNLRAAFFKNDGTKMYVSGAANDTIYQYSTTGSGGAAATFTYPSSVKWHDGQVPASPAIGSSNVLSFSTSDGGTTWYGYSIGESLS